jgi:3-hydroxyisobutyrate dehydrogenase
MWLELLLRAAAIYISVPFLPLTLAAIAWHACSRPSWTSAGSQPLRYLSSGATTPSAPTPATLGPRPNPRSRPREGQAMAQQVLMLRQNRGQDSYTMRDGMVLGAAVGFGFAAFDSAGCAFNALFTNSGLSLLNVVETEVLRGILAPVGHGLWTAILGGALFATAARHGRPRLTGSAVGFHVLVAALHGLWDASQPIAVWLTLLLIATPGAVAAAAARRDPGRDPWPGASVHVPQLGPARAGRPDRAAGLARTLAPSDHPRSPRTDRAASTGEPGRRRARQHKGAAAMSVSGQEPVAVLGIGAMGHGMATSTLRAGIPTVVWNRRPAATRGLAGLGAEVATTAADAARQAAIVITMVTDTDAVMSIARDQGMLAALAPGAIWAQMSTIGVAGAERVAAMVAAERPDVMLLDAPVSGSRDPAEQGQLTIFASGPEAARPRVTPLFDALGQRTIWVGGVGAGSRLKLVNNTLVAFAAEAVANAAAMAGRFGLETERVLEALGGSPLVSPWQAAKLQRIAKREFSAQFALALALKDVRLALQAAGGDRFAALAGLADEWQQAVDAGLGDQDLTVVTRVLEQPGVTP